MFEQPCINPDNRQRPTKCECTKNTSAITRSILSNELVKFYTLSSEAQKARVFEMVKGAFVRSPRRRYRVIVNSKRQKINLLCGMNFLVAIVPEKSTPIFFVSTPSTCSIMPVLMM